MQVEENESVIDMLTKRLEKIEAELAPKLLDREITRVALEAAKRGANIGFQPKKEVPSSSETEPTFKGKIKITLSEKFPTGATAMEILAYVNSRWKRQILRSSLSPQLSRLKNDDGIIEYDENTRKWHLKKETPDDAGVFGEFL